MPPFVLNDESIINSYGFVLLNSGGKFDRFKENPVMLDAHNNSTAAAVIGRWNNLRIEGPKLIADPEFDKDDPDAAKIAGKVDRNFVKGTSMGVMIEDAEMRELPGYGYIPVATSWELLEASPVGVPSNRAALRLYAKDGKTLLSAGDIKLSIENLVHKFQPNMEKIMLSVEAAKVLGIARDPEAADLNAAVMELSAKYTQLSTDKAKAEKDLNDYKAERAKDLVELSIREGRITADRKDSFVKLATDDFKQAKEILEGMPAKQTFSSETRPASRPGADREGWDYMKWLKDDPKGLSAMEQNDPDGFAKLKANYRRG